MSQAFVIFVDSQHWRLGVVDKGNCTIASLDESLARADTGRAEALATALRQHGYRGQPLVLALPSHWCLSGVISVAGLPRQHRSLAMLYRFEEKLPVPAEDVVADFIVDKKEAFAACVQIAQVQPILDVLDEAGVVVQHICADGLLALQQWTSEIDYELVVADRDEELELFTLHSKRPRSWYVLPPGTASIAGLGAINVGAHALTIGDRASAVMSDPDIKMEVTRIAEPLFWQAAALAAAQVLVGRLRPWIDLRQGALAMPHPYRRLRVPILAAVTSTIVLLMSLACATYWRSQNYLKMTAQLEQDQRAVFQTLFPSGATPPSVRFRMLSEARRLRGLSGASSSLPSQTDALELLRNVVTHLPVGLRYRLLELRLGPEKLFMEGQARSHADVDAINKSLRQSGVLDLDAPRTAQMPENSVSFTITGACTRPTVTMALKEGP